jgi:telomerase protein component 1
MAAIRNLRNLVLSGVDDDHVQKVCKMLTNEKMVAGSRLFPFRFFTAYDILDDLEAFSNEG